MNEIPPLLFCCIVAADERRGGYFVHNIMWKKGGISWWICMWWPSVRRRARAHSKRPRTLCLTFSGGGFELAATTIASSQARNRTPVIPFGDWELVRAPPRHSVSVWRLNRAHTVAGRRVFVFKTRTRITNEIKRHHNLKSLCLKYSPFYVIKTRLYFKWHTTKS